MADLTAIRLPDWPAALWAPCRYIVSRHPGAEAVQAVQALLLRAYFDGRSPQGVRGADIAGLAREAVRALPPGTKVSCEGESYYFDALRDGHWLAPSFVFVLAIDNFGALPKLEGVDG